jgi:hypothetical protein
MRKRIVPIAMLVAIGAVVTAFGAAAARSERSDCPGKIVCPLTGELVCRDRCPAVDPQRDDCPGRIECPLTGEPVCKDRCPLGDQAAGLPVCCRTRK